MSKRRSNQNDGPLFRPAEFREMKADPTYTSGPAARHPRNPIASVHLGVIRDVAAATRSAGATGAGVQPLHSDTAQRANRRRAAAKLEREAVSRASQDQARQRLAGLRKGRARRPESLTGRIVAVLRAADRWLTTRELIDILNDPARTPPTASTRTIRGSDVAACLAGYCKEGAVLARPIAEGSRLLEWRWAAFEAADAAAEAADAEAAEAAA
jgi:hypothetical protein